MLGMPTSTLFDRTLERLGRALRDVTGNARVALTGQLRPDLPDDDADRLRRQIGDCLSGPGGEVSARARAAELGRTYLSLAPEGRLRFLLILAEEYGVDAAVLDRAMTAVSAATNLNQRLKAESALRQALNSPRIILLSKFNELSGGVKFLVDMRAELSAQVKANPSLHALDDELRILLTGWFDVGFLDLSRITWQAPAALLEKLITYESVHAIKSWQDLKNRLDSDRRCYAFFHPRMPDEPLIFVEVALVQGMAGEIAPLLDEHAPAGDPGQADTAIFYSISNCQRGLSGVSFGNFLIKRVVDALSRDLPNLKTFATLSPIPGFRAWLDRQIAARAPGLLTNGELAALGGEVGDPASAGQCLTAALAQHDWHGDPVQAELLQAPLLRLCARYLIEEKAGDRALDRVAHFHLTNGARLERLNWLADTSPAGFRHSAGLMVNYRYKQDEIEANHELYRTDGSVAAAPSVRRLLKA